MMSLRTVLRMEDNRVDSTPAQRATSFGAVASNYHTFRPGPPAEALDWIFPKPIDTVVDLGAGTGALTRLLLPVASTVVAVEPDLGMRSELTRSLPGVTVLDGRGEAMPLADDSADAIVASSSWHWVDTEAGTSEAARVLRPGGTLAALWSGPDPDGSFMATAQAALGSAEAGPVLEGTLSGRFTPDLALDIPIGAPFSGVETEVFRWTMALTADQLIGLLGTLSWVIVLPEDERRQLIATARRLLRDVLGIEGAVTADVDYRCTAFRCMRA